MKHNVGNAMVFPANAQVRHHLMEMLGDRARSVPNKEKREHFRYPLPSIIEKAEIQHPGGSKVHAEVLVYNLSSGGIGFVYTGYLHRSTEITITLHTLRGELRELSGKVAWCALLTRQFHAVGMQCDEKSDPRDYIEPSIIAVHNVEDESARRKALRGRVLLVEDDKMEANLVKMLLSDTSLRVDVASDTGEALDCLRTESFDIVLADSVLHRDTRVDQYVPRMRDEGFTGPIVLFLQQRDNIDPNGSLPGACTDVVAKPLNQDELIAVIERALRHSHDPTCSTDLIYSTMKDALKFTSWIAEYIEVVRKKAKLIEEALRSENVELAMDECSAICATGVSYGFEILSEAAQETITALKSSASCTESAAEIRKLLRVIKRLSIQGY
ncbi:MAG: response regulator [Phycisphaeraceae bacterium]|nr:response regulator [Phycisphaerales bacterium]MCB9860482.1 response regulator [Phycisphaeraceae bacterium]